MERAGLKLNEKLESHDNSDSSNINVRTGP